MVKDCDIADLNIEKGKPWKPLWDGAIIPLAFLPAALSAFIVVPGWAKGAILVSAVSFLAFTGGEIAELKERPKHIQTFHFKHQYSVSLNFMQGLCLGSWVELLCKHWRHLDWHIYWFRIAHLTVMSMISSVLGTIQDFLYGRDLTMVQVNDRPVFIIGHPRTGTTHLHNLLSLDSEAFIYANAIQCGFPHAMVLLSSIQSWLRFLLPQKRPMDNVALGETSPLEDELAVAHLSGGLSPYMSTVLMTRELDFRPYFSFEDAKPEERQRWVESFLWFIKMVTFCSDVKGREEGPRKNRRLVLKSPCHVSRVKLLHQLFPKAQFIYIHRNPYKVWKSAAHMADTTYWHFYLSKPTDEQITEFILRQYEINFEDYVEARKYIPKNQLLEVSYRDLSSKPLETMERIYTYFDWSSWSFAKEKMSSYLQSLGNYEKNSFAKVEEPMRSYVYDRWKDSFIEFGYGEMEFQE